MKPILFNTQMVRAVLDGRKTVTRRVVRLKYSNTHLEMRTNKYGTRLIELQNEEQGVTTIRNPDGTTTHRILAAEEKARPYCPGDILWVRETWCESLGQAGKYFYRAYAGPTDEMKEYAHSFNRWRPSIHMPKDATRIFLRVKGVRMELLQDIDDDGAKAEGANYQDGKNVGWEEKMRRSAIDRFAEIWDNTLKPADRALYGWAANPWVWVIEFERISKAEALGGGGAK